MMRSDGRAADQLRPVLIVPHFTVHPDGSVLIEWGATRVICTASVEETVPPFLRDSGRGWVTAEYSMLPGASRPRVAREAAKGKVSGRTQEIQRLIGRSLRAVIDTTRLGPRTVQIDCDVIQADGGTRTAAITGAYVALALACRKLLGEGRVSTDPLLGAVAAVSVGVVDGEALLDLCYSEDSRADVDMNVVVTGAGEFIEVQGTAEGSPFDRRRLDRMLDLALTGAERLFAVQRATLEAS